MTISLGSSGGWAGISYQGSTETSVYNLVNTSNCVLYAPLTTSLLLNKGTGTPTYTRTTEAWGFNESNNLINIPIGCPDLDGARLVYNQIAGSSEDFSNVAWIKSNVTVTGTNTVVSSVGSSIQRIYNTNSYSFKFGGVYALTARLSYINHPFVQLNIGTGSSAGFCNFDLLNGTLFAGGNATGRIVPVSPGVYDCTAYITCTVGGYVGSAPLVIFINNLVTGITPSFTGDGIKSFNISRLQISCVTGYSSVYTPEYISVGIESTPYNGAGIDGAKYFSTDSTNSVILNNLNGINIKSAATNYLLRSRRFANPSVNDLTSGSSWLCTQTIGSELITNGTFDVDATWVKGATWTIGSGVATCTTSVGDSISQNLVGAGLTSGKTYVVTYTITRTTGSIVVSLGSSTNDLGKVRTASGTYTDMIYCGVNTTLYFYAYGNFAGTLDNVSIKECAMQIAFTKGMDGGLNTATTLTAADTDATLLQAITLGSAARCGSVYIKRRTGIGVISFTIDDGSSWTDITSQINGDSWTRIQITTTLTNPSVGFKISTSGDAIDVDCVQLESGSIATSPIVTTTAVVTRNADSLSYQTTSNWSNTLGTAYIEVKPLVYSGGALGSATNGLLLSTSNSGATAFDGANTANGPTGTPGITEKLALNWVGSTMKVASSTEVGIAGTYDGDMGLINIGIGVGANGNFKNVSIYSYALSDDNMKQITS